MAAHDLVDCRLQRLQVERSTQLERPGDVVDGRVLRRLVDEPEALLGERARWWLRDRGEGRGPLTLGRVDAAPETGDGRIGEELAQLDRGSESVANERDQSRGADRVASRLEEVV